MLGATRLVILAGPWAFKLPRPGPWRNFLQGLLANMQERSFSALRHPRLCPVVFALAGGWLCVMRRARPIPDALWERHDHQEFVECGCLVLPVENKRSSLGLLEGRVVAVDYGS